MVDSEFIIKYTNALYATPTESCPRYDEFRDMFSYGQIHSKTWLAQELLKANPSATSFCICGAWFASLAFYIKTSFPNAIVRCIDIDPRCEVFIKTLIEISHDQKWLVAQTTNMQSLSFEEDCIINTSCEHIKNLESWLQKIPPKRLVVLQSTDYKKGVDHISTVNNLEQFHIQIGAGLKRILFSGEKKLNVYTRFMVIGET
jgi:hypothetical protein